MSGALRTETSIRWPMFQDYVDFVQTNEASNPQERKH